MALLELSFLVDRCGALVLSSGRGLSRARRGTDIHGEWTFIANGARSSRSASGPLVSPLPPVRGGVGEGRGAATRPEPCTRALVTAVRGALPVWSPFGPLPRAGEGWFVRGAACHSRSVCGRLAFAILVGAPGTSQDLERCPFLSRRRRLPFPLVPPVLGFACPAASVVRFPFSLWVRAPLVRKKGGSSEKRAGERLRVVLPVSERGPWSGERPPCRVMCALGALPGGER